MSDANQIFEVGFGEPMAWIFTTTGEILKDYDEQPISKYLVEFEYCYKEEEDDECILKFKFPTLRSFDLPYFQQDVILVVQWGYLVDNKRFIKSPTRKVAIRDLESNYKNDGIELEIKCTDLVAYLKGFQTRTVRHYQDTGDSSGQGVAVSKSEDNFLNYIKEMTNGQFKVTLTSNSNAMRIDKFGEETVAKYDEKTGTYSSAIDNVRVRKDIVTQFSTKKVIKGKSKAITNAINDQLKLLDQQQAALSAKGVNGGKGPFIQDGTDDTLEIKQRNFNQNIFRTYTYYGGAGELLRFKSSTNTRKEKKDIAVNSGVNPYNKKINTTTIATGDTKSLAKGKIDPILNVRQPANQAELGHILVEDNKKKFSTKPTREELEQYLRDTRENFDYNFKNPLKQKELPNLSYQRTAMKGSGQVTVNIPSQAVLNMPEFKSLAADVSNGIKAQYGRQSVLTGYTVEKIQRKYDGELEVLGDPSLIKGKVIFLGNVGRLDRGKWYIMSASHKITFGEGYICTLNCMRNPSTVGLSLRTYAANPKFDKKSDKLQWEENVEDETALLFEDDNTEPVNNSSQMDTKTEDKYKEEREMEVIERLNWIQSEEDFKLGKDKGDFDKPVTQEEREELDKPNTDKW
jgi:hypothetical protein